MRTTLSSFFLLTCVAAQAPQHVASAPDAAAGLSTVDGRTIGIGPRYTAEFDGGGITFRPGFGPTITAHQLRFELQSITRGATTLYVAEPVEPIVRGETAVYHRGAIEERYRVDADGVHQSFWFPEQLPGSGDLVVTGRIVTDFDSVSSAADGLHYSVSGAGEVRFGAVTGIDAAGNSQSGELRLNGDSLQLVLPEEFIATAKFPLLLDPLIGVETTLSSTSDVVDPDVAYDFTTDTYLVVWNYTPSAGSHELRGSLVDATTHIATTSFPIGTGSTLRYQPAVANLNNSNQFVVAYRTDTGGNRICVRRVDPATGVVSGRVTVGGTTAGSQPDVGGHRFGTEALVVWRGITGIRGSHVEVTAGALPVATGPFSITATAGDSRPRISKAQRLVAPHYMVVWQRSQQIWALLSEDDGTIIAPETQITLSSTSNIKRRADVDGDGTDYLIAYEREETTSAEWDTWVVPVTTTATSIVAPTSSQFVNIAADPSRNELDPAIAWAGRKAMLTYTRDTGLTSQVHYVGLDAATGKACEPDTRISFLFSLGALDSTVCAQWAGDTNAGDEGYSAWKDGEMRGRRVEAFGGGVITNLGGGGPAGGTVSTVGPAAIGNTDFALSLSGANGPIALLSFGSPTAPMFTCGPIDSILPSAFITVGPVALTAGSGSFSLPLPCGLPPQTIRAQWTVVGTPVSPCPLFPSFSASNTLEIAVNY